MIAVTKAGMRRETDPVIKEVPGAEARGPGYLSVWKTKSKQESQDSCLSVERGGSGDKNKFPEKDEFAMLT